MCVAVIGVIAQAVGTLGLDPWRISWRIEFTGTPKRLGVWTWFSSAAGFPGIEDLASE
jgi:hypothetical protein